jgi:enoyl-CoA hydratase/carnithine racemase
MEMMFTGDEISAADAERWGLVNRLVEPGQLLPEAMALATRIARGPSIAIELAKRLILDATNRDGLRRQLQNEAWAQDVARSSEDQQEGISAFLEKRQPQWRGR